MKKTISFALTVVLAFTLITGGVSTVAETESAVTLIACSDFQNPNGNDAGKATVQNILSRNGARRRHKRRRLLLLPGIMITI